MLASLLRMTNFETPPRDPRGRKSRWTDLAAELRARPGEWARLPGTWSSGQASAINQGKLKDFPAGEFEATGRRTEGGYAVWVRFTG